MFPLIAIGAFLAGGLALASASDSTDTQGVSARKKPVADASEVGPQSYIVTPIGPSNSMRSSPISVVDGIRKFIV